MQGSGGQWAKSSRGRIRSLFGLCCFTAGQASSHPLPHWTDSRSRDLRFVPNFAIHQLCDLQQMICPLWALGPMAVQGQRSVRTWAQPAWLSRCQQRRQSYLVLQYFLEFGLNLVVEEIQQPPGERSTVDGRLCVTEHSDGGQQGKPGPGFWLGQFPWEFSPPHPGTLLGPRVPTPSTLSDSRHLASECPATYQANSIVFLGGGGRGGGGEGAWESIFF